MTGNPRIEAAERRFTDDVRKVVREEISASQDADAAEWLDLSRDQLRLDDARLAHERRQLSAIETAVAVLKVRPLERITTISIDDDGNEVTEDLDLLDLGDGKVTSRSVPLSTRVRPHRPVWDRVAPEPQLVQRGRVVRHQAKAPKPEPAPLQKLRAMAGVRDPEPATSSLDVLKRKAGVR